MTIYKVVLSREAQEHIRKHELSGKKQFTRKIASFIVELGEHPRTGTGQPERLRHMTGEYWSRRIDSKHRLIYEIIDTDLIVIAVSAYGHYDDK